MFPFNNINSRKVDNLYYSEICVTERVKKALMENEQPILKTYKHTKQTSIRRPIWVFYFVRKNYNSKTLIFFFTICHFKHFISEESIFDKLNKSTVNGNWKYDIF